MTSYVANNNPHVSSYLFSRYSTYYQSFCLPCSTYHFPAFLPHSPMLPPYVFLRKPNTPFGPAPIPSRASSRPLVGLLARGCGQAPERLWACGEMANTVEVAGNSPPPKNMQPHDTWWPRKRVQHVRGRSFFLWRQKRVSRAREGKKIDTKSYLFYYIPIY